MAEPRQAHSCKSGPSASPSKHSRHRARYALRRGRGVRAGAVRGVHSGADGGEQSEEGAAEERSEEGWGSSDEGDEGSEEEGS